MYRLQTNKCNIKKKPLKTKTKIVLENGIRTASIKCFVEFARH